MTCGGFGNPHNRRYVGFNNEQYRAANLSAAYRIPPTGNAKIFHDALVRELGEDAKMTMHKINSAGQIACGRTAINVAHAMYWDGVTCEECLAMKPADAGARTSIKRSHRAEGNNWID